MQDRVGKYDRNTWLDTIELAAFETYKLERGDDNIALVDGDIPDVQIICDGRANRLKIGQSLPANGHQRFVRNPYSQTVAITLAYGHPVSFDWSSSAWNPRFNEKVKTRVAIATGETTTGSDIWGAFFLPKRSSYHISADMLGNNHSCYIIPKAKPSYIDDMPVTLHNNPPASHQNGDKNDDIICRWGRYNDDQIAAWIAASNWQENLVESVLYHSKVTSFISPDTAIIIYSSTNSKFRVNAELTEIGNWDPERR